MRSRVVVAMSGGVDSSLAAALLKEAGYEVIGVALKLRADHQAGVDEARHACRAIGVPFNVLHLEPQFEAHVVDYFCREYALGRTPNPCLACNRRIKFELLLKEAMAMGADCLATGHYARIEPAAGRYRLLKACDQTRDQSYFLYALGQEELMHLFFPLGGYGKGDVRRMAGERGLNAARGESRDICFIPEGDYRSFLSQRLPLTLGPIMDLEGRVLGEHRGIALYTVGQRHGLGIASYEPLYVLSVDATNNTLVVGPGGMLWSRTLVARDVSFICGEAPRGEIEVGTRIRYRSTEAKAVLSAKGEFVELRFYQPQRAITPGQAVVFYDGDEVLGGGIIEKAA